MIVPCFRHGSFLAACIESVRAQTLPAAQIVVVDDGSDDPRRSTALARLERDRDVTVFAQPSNRGPSAARNRALRSSSTSYVLPLDADDLLLPDALERMVAQLEAAPEDVGFVYPNAQHFGNRDDYVRVARLQPLSAADAQNYCPATALFDRRVFGRRGPLRRGIVLGHEDWDLDPAARPSAGCTAGARRGPHVPVPHDGIQPRQRGRLRARGLRRGRSGRGTRGSTAPRETIKARWAPALSIVLIDDDQGAGTPGDLSWREAQTWRDFELLARRDLGEEAVVVGGEDDAPPAWLE